MDPLYEEITDTLTTIGPEPDLDPTSDKHDAVERLLLDLVTVHGFDAGQAYQLVRTIYWRGWNQGYDKGFTAGRL
jgi:hypothetical protein